MNEPVPKQFLTLAGKPILVHTLDAFISWDAHIKTVLVLPEDHLPTWNKIKDKYYPRREIIVAFGGETRFQSVRSGLNEIHEENALVAVHDAVRPFITSDIIRDSYTQAEESGAAIVAIKLKDTIRKVTTVSNEVLDRDAYRLVQTPQVFRVSLLQAAYRQQEKRIFTDDASVVEALGERVTLVEGSYTNIKITTREDLLYGEWLLSMKSDDDRT